MCVGHVEFDHMIRRLLHVRKSWPPWVKPAPSSCNPFFGRRYPSNFRAFQVKTTPIQRMMNAVRRGFGSELGKVVGKSKHICVQEGEERLKSDPQKNDSNHFSFCLCAVPASAMSKRARGKVGPRHEGKASGRCVTPPYVRAVCPPAPAPSGL